MKKSLRARRIVRRQQRLQSPAKLYLVSVLDIFILLIFFLLVNSANVDVLQNNNTLQLPISRVNQIPDTTLMVTVNERYIIVAGRVLVSVAEIMQRPEDTIQELTQELNYQASRRLLTPKEQQLGRALTILGDRRISYVLLKRLMKTCVAAGFRDISLAVRQLAATDSIDPYHYRLDPWWEN